MGGCKKEEPRPSPPPKAETGEKAKPEAAPPVAAPQDASPKTTAPAPGPVSTSPAAASQAATPAPAKAAAQKPGPMRLGETRKPAPGAGQPSAAGKAAPGGKPRPGRVGKSSKPWKPIQPSDRMYYCLSCKQTFTLSYKEAAPQLREAAKRAPRKRPKLKCIKCGKVEAVPAMKCVKCGAIITGPEEIPEPKSIFQGTGPFPDECKKCGYSQMREGILRGVRQRMKQGKLDMEKLPPMVRRAIEDAKAKGQWEEK